MFLRFFGKRAPFGHLLVALGHRVQIGEGQLDVDCFDIPFGIDVAVDVDDVAVLEAADHVGDHAHLPDRGQKTVPQPFPPARAGDQAGDIDEFNGGGNLLFTGDQFCDPIKAGIGNSDDSDVRIDRAKRIVRHVGRSTGEC